MMGIRQPQETTPLPLGVWW